MCIRDRATVCTETIGIEVCKEYTLLAQAIQMNSNIRLTTQRSHQLGRETFQDDKNHIGTTGCK